MTEIVFLVEDAPEGGYLARALEHSIHTDADSFDELHQRVRNAVQCHFGAAACAAISLRYGQSITLGS